MEKELSSRSKRRSHPSFAGKKNETCRNELTQNSRLNKALSICARVWTFSRQQMSFVQVIKFGLLLPIKVIYFHKGHRCKCLLKHFKSLTKGDFTPKLFVPP